MLSAVAIVVRVLSDLIWWIGLGFRRRGSLEAEVLFLRRQLALYVERRVKPHRVDAATRMSLALLSRLFEWRSALVVIRSETLIRWHRAGFRLFWKWKSRAGRPPIPLELRELIRKMAKENPLWGQERIANELWVKLGLRVSPRTVRKYLPRAPAGRPRGDQRWLTFLRNHAQAIVACDFFVTTNRTAAGNCSSRCARYGYLIHDRDSIFSLELDNCVESFGLRVMKTPPRCPMANGMCERVIGTIRRECLDCLIPFSEAHLRRILKSWIGHYNRGRPHMALGPGVPDPPATVSRSMPRTRHILNDFGSVRSKALLGGLHHEYSIAPT